MTPIGPPQVTVNKKYEFQNGERTGGIIVSPDAVAYHVSRYRTFEDFCEMLSTALETVHGIVELGLVERVGLRYVDLVRPGPSESRSAYFSSGLLGLDESRLETKDSKFAAEQLGKTEAGVLAVRLYQRDDGGFLPPDLEPSPLEHQNPKLNHGEKATLLDIDHYAEFEKSAIEFSVAKIMDLFWRLHNNADLAFAAAVTDHAREVWGTK